jgi:hypothetical protein
MNLHDEVRKEITRCHEVLAQYRAFGWTGQVAMNRMNIQRSQMIMVNIWRAEKALADSDRERLENALKALQEYEY